VKKAKKKGKNRLEFRFALFCFKKKLLNQSEAKNLKRKKAKYRLEFRFALFHFEAKMTKVKRSKKFEAKISEKREVKFYSEIVKHM
jgi:hypothetical protein